MSIFEALFKRWLDRSLDRSKAVDGQQSSFESASLEVKRLHSERARRAFRVRAGRARAKTARRDEKGRFL